MTTGEQRPGVPTRAVPDTGPWGAVHTVRALGDGLQQVEAEDGGGLVFAAADTHEIDPPLQPFGPVTGTGGRELRWVPEGVGADVVRLYFSAWGRIDLAGAGA